MTATSAPLAATALMRTWSCYNLCTVLPLLLLLFVPPLPAAGDGHFSPIGGYSACEDMVLILDTARFKYPPHWVPLEMLYK